MILRYEIGFRLEGQPGVIVNDQGKEIFKNDMPGMTLTVMLT
jgi:hypothetical protein